MAETVTTFAPPSVPDASEMKAIQEVFTNLAVLDLKALAPDREAIALLAVSAPEVNVQWEDEAFGPVTESVGRMMEASPGQADMTRIQEPVSFPADIAFLEKNLLSPEHGTYAAVPSSVRLYAAPSPYAEAHHAAEEILSLWLQGVPFSS